jgi:PPOX class probable F420-dependent enzyme
MAEKLSDDQIALLREPVLAHIATVMADGSPQVTPVWIDTDGEAVIFNTAKGRAKYNNLVRNPKVAISVADPSDHYRTVVVRGTAEMTEAGADAHIDMLARKYTGEEYKNRTPGMVRVIVRVVPERVLR